MSLDLKSNLQVEERNFLSRLDLNFAFAIFALNLIGLINLYSATHGIFHRDKSNLFWMQIAWLVVGWLIYLGITLVDYRSLVKKAYWIYGLNMVALVAVGFVGTVSYGARRWLDLGFFKYQPSESMKVFLILVMAKILAKMKPNSAMGIKELAWPALIVLIPWALTVKQPDLGTATLMLATSGSMILFVGIKRGILIFAALVGIIAAPLIWNFGLKEYQRNRVLTFLSPGRDPRGTGYNSIQSKIAVGSGRIVGKGFRKGTQSQLEFLPERHTDFIYSVLSEEHGFIGSFITLGLFFVVYLMSIKIAIHARDRTGSLIVIGVGGYLFWHMFVNIGMVIGLLPIVGAPLPLISYGGSSLLTTMLALGLISSVSYRKYLF
tara:strand:+ start:1698 stop:2831 length:1134 start_codon:yes stop_codon:yes gene_type:complete